LDRSLPRLRSWGKRGTAPGEFANVLSIAVDGKGNVYAGDGGNKRIEVFDNNGKFKTAFSSVGNPQAMCMTKGASPVLYVSNSNPWNDIDVAGEIYKKATGRNDRRRVRAARKVDIARRWALLWRQREGRIQSAERAVPTLQRTSKVTNLLSA
jgi:hypothetical protein